MKQLLRFQLKTAYHRCFWHVTFWAFAIMTSAACQTVPVVTYDVHGSRTQDLLFDLKENPQGPKDSWGHRGAAMTHCQVRLSLEGTQKMRIRPNQCVCKASVAKADLAVDIQLIMPRWVEKNNSSSDCQKKWQRFLEATDFHEQGHVSICQEGAARIKKAVKKASRQISRKRGRNCDFVCDAAWDEVKSIVQNAYQKEFKRLEQKQIKYDKETRHGQTQGGILSSCQ